MANVNTHTIEANSRSRNRDDTSTPFLESPSREENKVYSIGYQEKNIDFFIEYLVSQNIQQLIDIRDYPNSRKKGFSKSRLSEHLEQRGIDYKHIPELGTEKESRNNYRETGDLNKLLTDFEEKLKENVSSLDELKELVQYNASVIMCYEKDHKECHRQVLEYELENEGFEVVHL